LTDDEILVNKKPHRVMVLERNGKSFLVSVNEKVVTAKMKNPRQEKSVIVEIDGKSIQAKIDRIQRKILQIEIDGKSFRVQLSPEISKEKTAGLEPRTNIVRKPTMRTRVSIDKDAVTAPIAGRIVLLKAYEGQKIEKGECICVLEAMKMENEIAAPKAGIIKEIRVSEGTVVNERDILAIIT